MAGRDPAAHRTVLAVSARARRRRGRAARARSGENCIERFPLSHRAASVAFRFAVESSKWKLDTDALQARGVAPGPDWGKLFAGNDVTLADGSVLKADDFRTMQTERGSVVVGGDNETPALLWDACATAQVLVHEATYTEETLQKIGPGPTHSSAQGVAQFAAERRLPNLVLTHFSPRYDSRSRVAELEAEARLHYSGQLHMAEDFASFELDGAERAAAPVAPMAPMAPIAAYHIRSSGIWKAA
ncbi:hypothetical protein LP420_15085 [Massilia sp. B-10]|nr:hypothetical protein LP420_15085 [Massilia sp. B-10]